MLVALSIRDLVVIDRLDLRLVAGLTVLTGETGAGKSILLDALGLALGARAEGAVVRRGAERATATAEFALPDGHPARALLAERGIEFNDSLVLRRVVGVDGRSRAFANDEPVSVGFLRDLGTLLVEIESQSEAHGLLDSATHRALLDAFAGNGALANATRDAYAAWREAAAAEAEARAATDKARAEEDLLRHSEAELAAFDPMPDEEPKLADERAFLMGATRLAEAVSSARAEIGHGRGVSGALNSAHRMLARQAGAGGERLAPALQALERAALEAGEAESALDALARELDPDPRRLEAIEERLFGIRELSRKYNVMADKLPALLDEIRGKLAALDQGTDATKALAARTKGARDAFVAAAKALSDARTKAASELDAIVGRELKPLKLEKAVFRTCLESLSPDDAGPEGAERVAFEIATIPGATPGALGKVASGGELSRIMLALKVALAAAGDATTLVFDEVDSGVGGATAAAIGERLAKLARKRQVIVVTHSPQVAARGDRHLRVEKKVASQGATADVRMLEPSHRREEIARMLAGARVTDEARAAADRLLAGNA
ncbi:MAG TPA: DNA repair protein RecN [Alphaproteobacteria bacterium]|jgi:DNA repair protein RecN (Recombination protein N)|nr:DNA repair protein RecN [Alphaproteobacteria bacterium]